MRTEQEMFDLILTTANADERIRTVLLNGSRVNSNVKKDRFQDFDIVYLVTSVESFVADHSWVDQFGDRIMIQMPEIMGEGTVSDGRYVYLMWFKDGNRIDLTLIPVNKRAELMQPDSLTEVLIDKDGIIGELPPASDKDYHIEAPGEKKFLDTCNEFWWISMNVAKGLARHELSYAMWMYENINRNMLMRMMDWRIGLDADFAVSSGKLGKFYEKMLTAKEWESFVATYSDGDYDHIWEALMTMADLFSATAHKVAKKLRFNYNHSEENNVRDYLSQVREMVG